VFSQDFDRLSLACEEKHLSVFNYRVRHFFEKFWTNKTHQLIELESCSNPLKMQQVK